MKSFLIIMIFLFLLSVANAKIIYVPADQTTIQAGIDAASTGDTVLVADGTYIGAGNKSINFRGKEIIVRSENGPQNCIIDCEKSDMAIAFVFSGSENTNCIAEGFTIKNGHIGFWLYGNPSPTISKNIIEDFSVGIYCSANTAPLIIGNTIKNNNNVGPFPENGGGISLFGSAATIMNNIIYENSSEKGGGIYCSNSPSATIINNTIIDNVVIFGGGVYIDESPMILTNNIIAFSKYKPALNLNIYTYNFETNTNYEGAKITSIDYTFVLHNQGNSGLVNFLSTSSFGGKNIDSTFQMSTGERKTIYINSKVNEFGDFGGLTLVISLNNDTLFVNADGPSSFRPGSYFLTFAMDSDAIPASKEIIEIGQGSEITFCDIFGNGEGNYYSGASDFELVEIVLAGMNGNLSEDPLCSYPDYFFTDNSPCIDAGNPDPAFNDSSIPPGMGSERCDIGASGGPGNYILNITSVNQFLSLPSQFKLNQNYPNPFNSSTQIEIAVQKTCHVTLRVYDILGRLISTLVDQNMSTGNYKVEFHASDMASGIYLYQIQMGDYTATKKMLLSK